MSLFRRPASQVSLAELPPAGTETETTPESVALDFVEGNRKLLAASSTSWNMVYAMAEGVKNDEIKAAILEGVVEVFGAGNVPDSHVHHVTKRLVNDFSTLCFVTARVGSEIGVMSSAARTGQLLFDKLDESSFYVATRKGGPSKDYATATVEMIMNMVAADKAANEVIKGLKDCIARSPGSLTALSELFDNGAGQADPAFAELKEVIRTDWHSTDRSKSQLREFLGELSVEDDLFLSEFVDSVWESNDKKLVYARKMAMFALAASEMDGSEDNLKAILIKTRTAWEGFEDINGPYQDYKFQRLAGLKAAFDKISGLPTEDNLRQRRTESDVAAIKAKFGMSLESRDERRKRKIYQSTVKPVTVDTQKALENSERYERETKPIYLARNGGSSYRAEEASEAVLEEVVASKTEKHLVADIMSCIKRIHENPFSPASRVISSGRGTVTIDNRTIKLRRFKPNNAVDLGVSREAASWRICYGVIKGSVVITDILRHEQFDQKYK